MFKLKWFAPPCCPFLSLVNVKHYLLWTFCESDLPHCSRYLSGSVTMPHHLLWMFCPQSTSLSFCCCTLACGLNNSSCCRFTQNIICDGFIGLLEWLATQNPLSCIFCIDRKMWRVQCWPTAQWETCGATSKQKQMLKSVWVKLRPTTGYAIICSRFFLAMTL